MKSSLPKRIYSLINRIIDNSNEIDLNIKEALKNIKVFMYEMDEVYIETDCIPGTDNYLFGYIKQPGNKRLVTGIEMTLVYKVQYKDEQVIKLPPSTVVNVSGAVRVFVSTYLFLWYCERANQGEFDNYGDIHF